MVEVTYQGPSSTYTVEHDGDWYDLQRGIGTAVPAALAEELADVEGHDFGEPAEHTVKVSPTAAKLATELGVDLDTVTGTGKSHSITKSDVQAAHDAATSDPDRVNDNGA
jgi:pyruvate dehydrogenase E2 component (dihydrolipoamide acetyltransferase)